jgi:RNA polymerase sigma-70 factor (ECF subfamily)
VERVVGQPSQPDAARTEADAETAALAALRAGDRRGALTILMRAHGHGIHRFCRASLQDAALADDIHQAVFVAAYEDLPTFEGRSSLQTWLYGIARHRCLDALKSRRRFGLRFLFGGAPPEEPDASPEPGEAIDGLQRGSALSSCLKQLQPHVRMAVLLRYGEGLSCEEIARASRERANTVQARVARALVALRRCLESREVTP